MKMLITKTIPFAFCFSLLLTTCSNASQSAGSNVVSSFPWRVAGAIGLGAATAPLAYLTFTQYDKFQSSRKLSQAAKEEQKNVIEYRTTLISSIQNQKAKAEETLLKFENLYQLYMPLKSQQATIEYGVLLKLYNRDYNAQEPNTFTDAFDKITLHQILADYANVHSNHKTKFIISAVTTALCGAGGFGLALWQFLSKKK